jgi:phenylacetate-CoA ligase
MGRADQTTKVRGMFVHPSQVAQVLKRFPALGRGRLVVSGEMANDAMTLQVETAGHPADLQARIGAAIRDVTKLRGDVECVTPGSLPNDGLVIQDARSYK